jgi:hypothetical protein
MPPGDLRRRQRHDCQKNIPGGRVHSLSHRATLSVFSFCLIPRLTCAFPPRSTSRPLPLTPPFHSLPLSLFSDFLRFSVSPSGRCRFLTPFSPALFVLPLSLCRRVALYADNRRIRGADAAVFGQSSEITRCWGGGGRGASVQRWLAAMTASPAGRLDLDQGIATSYTASLESISRRANPLTLVG